MRRKRGRNPSIDLRPEEDRAIYQNADRASLGELAVLSFATAAELSADVEVDPETVLCDLLTNLMHWSDAQKASGRLTEHLDFESALDRARDHYTAERAD